MDDISQKDVWNAIADKWNAYRKKIPEEVDEFLKGKNGLILDMGCGSGRNVVSGKKIVGMDFSKNMIKLAKKNRDGLFVIGDLRFLPFKDKVFDSILYVASLHCLEKGRKKSLDEMKRVMKKDSEAIITVWNRNQPRFKKKINYIPWKHGKETYMRYYYLFTQDELKNLIKECNLEILNIFGSTSKVFNMFPRNIIAIAKKK